MGLLQIEIGIMLLAAFLAGAACFSLFSGSGAGPKGSEHAG